MGLNRINSRVGVILLVSVIGFSATFHAGVHEPVSLKRAVFWQGEGARVFLVREQMWTFRLTVLSSEPLRVVYHTRRNSRDPVENVLNPKALTTPGVYEYSFRHRFSRTTIRMGLDFFLGDRKLDSLSRIFSGGLKEALDRSERSTEMRSPPDP